ncbi:AzlC family ABC transporter permease [Bacillus sp. CLL-7-23]|uniref:AzlC family ABC transporter permease n=1 Tax=Bacillus changyiensis TaxID=3004103 RepID=A0ABT4X5Q9_9BACI|nr:AzlC family ABC transporter permease [Bacillus changyiensis]MDA7027520.1 AzlC family ABC transporter permease [Bacillus changyiensis]
MSTETSLVKKEEVASSFVQGIKDCVPTLLGYTSIGFAFGVVGVSSNLSVAEIALLSALVYAGAAQFIICSMLVTNSPISAIILTTFIVNLRHFLLSASLAPYFSKYSLLKGLGIGLFITDESFGVASNKIIKSGQLYDRWMYGLNLTAYICWVISCVTGALCGNWISHPEQYGLDNALIAMFAALLVLQLDSVAPSKLTHYLRLVLYMVIAMLVLSLFISTHLAVILATIIVATIGVVTDK